MPKRKKQKHDSGKSPVKLSSRELASVLAGLRLLARMPNNAAEFMRLFDCDDPLTGGELDWLCQKLNLGG